MCMSLFSRDSLIVAFGNCLTSFFAGFVIFSFLGYLATEAGQPVESVVDDGKDEANMHCETL